jgi:hypothetical protein
MEWRVHTVVISMARRQGVHVLSINNVGWYPVESSLSDDEPTTRVPNPIIALAASLEDDTEVSTARMQALTDEHVASVVALKAARARPARVLESGTIPMGPVVARAVIPPRAAFAIAPLLRERSLDDLPPAAPADARLLRTVFVRSLASALLASCALLVLFVVGARPSVLVPPVARTARTSAPRAETAEKRRVVVDVPAPPRAAPVFVAVATFQPHRAAPLPRRASGDIIRAAPF